MPYRVMGRAHAWALAARDDERGQGTVEYVGLILLIAAVVTAVVAAAGTAGPGNIAKTVVTELNDAIEGVTNGRRRG